jgi:hypothetical protein
MRGRARRSAARTLGAVNDEHDQPRGEPAKDIAADNDDGLTAPMARTNGPPGDVVRNRAAAAGQDELDRQRWEKSIEAHIAAHRMALDFLAETHQWIADNYDFDLVGDSRQAATWQMSGRCIGIARLMCDALGLGYSAEVLHLARALHEADRLAAIFPQPEGTDLLRKWLADQGNEWVRPGEVRAAQEKFNERIVQLGGPDLEAVRELPREIYGEQSQAAHHRRKWTQDAVAPMLRTMLTGPTTVWHRRAVTTAAMLVVVEEAVVSVGDALGELMPPQWWIEHIKPFIEAFEALRVTNPLP